MKTKKHALDQFGFFKIKNTQIGQQIKILHKKHKCFIKIKQVYVQVSPNFSVCCTFLLMFSVSVNLPKFLEFQVSYPGDHGDNLTKSSISSSIQILVQLVRF